jgi:hypothetical protein
VSNLKAKFCFLSPHKTDRIKDYYFKKGRVQIGSRELNGSGHEDGKEGRE